MKSGLFKHTAISCLTSIIFGGQRLGRVFFQPDEGFQILAYHSARPEGTGPHSQRGLSFEDQMRYLFEKGYRVISLREYYDYGQRREAFPENAIAETRPVDRTQ